VSSHLLPLGFHSLSHGGIEIWAVALESTPSGIEACRSWLSPEEDAKATRFRFDEHRRDYILSHGALRLLVAAYQGVAPDVVTFSSGDHGKPFIAGKTTGETQCPIAFNMAHSGSFAVLAFASGGELGIDVERIREMPDLERIARHFFSPAEVGDLVALPGDQRTSGFFRCWTRKEAFLKAGGEGFSKPLDSFQVEFRPDRAPRILQPPGTVLSGWNLQDLKVGAAHVGALAYPGRPRQLHLKPMCSVDALVDDFRRI
jgi:4'-phosphopantetheinyl transferase